MSICRHVLLRAYTPRPARAFRTFGRLSAGTPNAPLSGRDGRDPREQETDARDGSAAARAPRSAVGSSPSSAAPSAKLDIPFLPKPPAMSAKTVPHKEGPADNIIATYEGLRRDGVPLYSLLPKEILQIIDTAETTGRADIIGHLVQDVVEAAPHLGQSFLQTVLERLLLLAEGRLLQRQHILSLLLALRSFGDFKSLSLDRRVPVVKAVMSLPPDPASDPQLLELLARLLFDLLVRPRSKHERRRSEQAVGLLYHLALDLARLKAREASLEIVRVLINTQNLLSSTAPGTARGSVDFEYIVLSAFLRSALHQGSRATAYRLVAKELSFHTAISAELVDLALDVVRALLRDPSNDDLNHACHLITLLIKSRPSCPIPNAVMKAFYAGTQHHNRSELAETVYGFARKAGASGWQTYAPPGGRVVTWLMEHFAHKSRNAHLARELATEAVKLNIPISLQDRGRFIALAAEQGFATQARALWERYAEGQEKEMVVGNTSTMLRLVSLFVSLTRREDSARLENAASQPASSGSRAVDIAAGMAGPRDNVSGDDAPPSLDSDSDRRASALAESRAPGVASEDASRNSMARLPAVEVVRTADAIPGSRTTPEHGTAFPSSDRGGQGPPPPGAAGDAQPSQFRAFAERVFEAFRTSREPWAEAQHFELNALARASFMLGYLEGGMQAFRIMLARREVPDLQDVNVALSILAEYNPTAAARVIERMVSAGLQPDKVTFGSVMHQAIIHRDGPLVAHLMRRARELNCAAFSYKTVGALVRATVTMEDDGRVPAREHLENARALIESLLERGQVPSANMGRDCVLAALRADEPLMAFRFWDRLVRDKAEWDDAVQRRTRRAIAGMVRAHCAAGWLDADMGRLVLTTLGARRAHGAGQADAGTERGG